MQRPDPAEYPAPFHAYVARVPDGDLLTHLESCGRTSCERLAAIDAGKAAFAYAPGKWSVKRVVQHVVDGERLFCYRALCLARGDRGNLPAFDEDLYASNDGSDQRSMAAIVAEFRSVRAASVQLFVGLDAAAWSRHGLANGRPVSVRSLPWILAGHELHHMAILRERYGIG